MIIIWDYIFSDTSCVSLIFISCIKLSLDVRGPGPYDGPYDDGYMPPRGPRPDPYGPPARDPYGGPVPPER